MVEVNSETDFVARNPQFQELVRAISSLAPQAKGDLAKLMALPYPGKGARWTSTSRNAIATIGENMSAAAHGRRCRCKDGVVADYVHNKAADGLGKIGVLVALESKGDKAALTALGRQIAMHIAAASPAAVSAEELDPALVERERRCLRRAGKGLGQVARTSSPRWWRGGCARSSTSRSCSCNRSSWAPAVTARPPWSRY